MTKNRGTSLFELLVVLTIFLIVVAAANQVFFTTLRGSKKSEVTSSVKQEANYAMSVIERALHSANSIVSCDDQTVTYLDADGRQSSFSCQNVGDNGYVASGSARLTSEAITVTACSVSCVVENGWNSVLFDLNFREAGLQIGRRLEEKAIYDLKTRVLLRN